ncbi:hypothetical protein GW17_00006161 [Ensete ventricosum]|nr:hypothetical protein GW17_00006161 [Ensete ventricosum]RZR79023.1 hypothetical protein BHM03_00004588 [Ensete ventricosum]
MEREREREKEKMEMRLAYVSLSLLCVIRALNSRGETTWRRTPGATPTGERRTVSSCTPEAPTTRTSSRAPSGTRR